MRGWPRRGALVATVLGALVLAACAPVAPSPPPTAPTPPPKATNGCQAAPGSVIAGQWIATVDPDGAAPPEVVPFDAATPSAKSAEIARLDQSGTVLSVEPDRVVKTLDTVNPGNDPRYATDQLADLQDAGFPAAWGAGFAGQGIVIAVLDTGSQADHEDLAGQVLPGADFVSDPVGGGAGTSDFGRIDGYGHGTHVAGIAAAADNALGGIGGAPQAKILPVRVLNSCGSGSFSGVADGITWAANNGAKVISMSLGGSGGCGSLQTAINDAISKGVIVVAAAGNSASSVPIVPAGCNGVLAVGATAGHTTNMTRASFSNYGSYVQIAAPGSAIWSTFLPAPSTYKTLSGTSMATPFVSAAAALVYEHCSPLPPNGSTVTKVRNLLVGNEGHVVASGLPYAVSVAPTNGTFTLSVGGQTTTPIAFDAPAATVSSALQLLSTVGSGNVTVTGGAGTYSITLANAAATNGPITVTPDSAAPYDVTAPFFPGRLDAGAAVAASCA